MDAEKLESLRFVCKSNGGDGCVKKAKRKVSFIVMSPSPLTSVTSSVNRLNESGAET